MTTEVKTILYYEATARDIVMAAGGPMGSPAVDLWRQPFHALDNAKSACETHYGKKIEWKKRGTLKNRSYYSGDLGHVDYTISVIHPK